MLKIRMQRIGRINMPSYRLIVVEHTESPKTGNFVEVVGTYNPRSKERMLDAEKIQAWIQKGAKPSDTVHNMLVSAGIINAKKINVLPAYKPARPDDSGHSGGVPADSTSSPQADALTDSTGSADSPQASSPHADAPAETPVETPVEKPAQ